MCHRSDAVGIEFDWFAPHEDWPKLMSLRDIEEFLRLNILNRRNIPKHARVTIPPRIIPKQGDWTGERPKGTTWRKKASDLRIVKWELTREVELAFGKLDEVRTEASIIPHCDPERLKMLRTDGRRLVIEGIFNVYHGFRVLRVGKVYSGKRSAAEQLVDT